MVFPQSMHRRVLKKKNMADGRAKLCVASSSKEDMCSSCFITTKYTCLKCKILFATTVRCLRKMKIPMVGHPLKALGTMRALCTGVCKRRQESGVRA